jgi:hypothetical protein
VEPLTADRLPDGTLEMPGMILPTNKILAVFESEYNELKDLFH